MIDFISNSDTAAFLRACADEETTADCALPLSVGQLAMAADAAISRAELLHRLNRDLRAVQTMLRSTYSEARSLEAQEGRLRAQLDAALAAREEP